MGVVQREGEGGKVEVLQREGVRGEGGGATEGRCEGGGWRCYRGKV